MAAQATEEELREAGRRHLGVYAHLVHVDDDTQKPLAATKHQKLWIELAHQIDAGELKRVLILAPPGGAKTTWFSLSFVPWYVQRHVDHSVLNMTSSDSQAAKIGTVVSNVLEKSPENAAIFPDPNCRADKDRGWSSEKGYFLKGKPMSSKDPNYQSAGFTSRILGARLRGIVLDDILDEQQSRSDLILADAKALIDNTLETRLHPTLGWMVCIMTSWNERDIPHFLANKQQWHVVHIPALGDPDIKPISPRAYFYHLEPGESFWPQRFPAEVLQAIRSDPDRGGAKFNAVFQADPTAMGGDVFKAASWFRPLPPDFDVRGGKDNRAPRERLRTVAYMDPNFSALKTSDETAIVTVGFDDVKNIYILGCRRGHFSVKSEYVDAIVEQIEIHQPALFGMEDSAWRQSFCREIWREVMRQVVIGSPHPNVPRGDKESRARVPASYGEQGKLYIDLEAPWAQDLIVQCLGFPNGLHDDMVDALSGACILARERLGTLGQPRDGEARQKYTMRAKTAA